MELSALESFDWTERVAALRALAAALEKEPIEEDALRAALAPLCTDPKWEVRRELALLLARPEVPLELADPLLSSLAADHTRWVRETAARSSKLRSAGRRARDLTPIPPEPHLTYVAERVAELGARSLEPHVVLDLVAQGGEYFYRALAAETAHEVRTLLTPIVGYFEKLVQHLESNGELDDKSSTYTRTISQRLDQLRALIDQITIYAGREEVELQASDLIPILEEALQIAREKCAAQVSIDRALPGSLVAEVSPSRLRQALVNLVTNALEAMQEGGTLGLRASIERGTARIRIADTGQGMTAAQIESAFLRFRTTKRARGGTGLGLPIAKRIIEDEHGGSLALTSSPGAGTTVELVIPLAQREQENGE
jgi:signal transduction histidine kinase